MRFLALLLLAGCTDHVDLYFRSSDRTSGIVIYEAVPDKGRYAFPEEAQTSYDLNDYVIREADVGSRFVFFAKLGSEEGPETTCQATQETLDTYGLVETDKSLRVRCDVYWRGWDDNL